MKRRIFGILLLCMAATCGFSNVSLILPIKSGMHGALITVPVKVKNFVNIESVQGTIHFDHAIVRYVSLQGFAFPDMNMSCFGLTDTANGNISFTWFDQTLAAPTLTDSSVIFSITFRIYGTVGQVANLTFANSPTPMEVADSSLVTQTLTLVNGSITVVNTTGIDPIVTADADSFCLNSFPNPFSNATHIIYNIAGDACVEISIINVLGEKVYGFVRESVSGQQEFIWNGTDYNGRKLENGLYYCVLSTGKDSFMRKILLRR